MDKFGVISPQITPDHSGKRPDGREKTAAELDDGILHDASERVSRRIAQQSSRPPSDKSKT